MGQKLDAEKCNYYFYYFLFRCCFEEKKSGASAPRCPASTLVHYNYSNIVITFTSDMFISSEEGDRHGARFYFSFELEPYFFSLHYSLVSINSPGCNGNKCKCVRLAKRSVDIIKM